MDRLAGPVASLSAFLGGTGIMGIDLPKLVGAALVSTTAALADPAPRHPIMVASHKVLARQHACT